MELFPSMTYNDIMAMPYKSFKLIYDIRAKRKIAESEKLKKEASKSEKENNRLIANANRRQSQQKRGAVPRWGRR